jgi:hypothetical protein
MMTYMTDIHHTPSPLRGISTLCLLWEDKPSVVASIAPIPQCPLILGGELFCSSACSPHRGGVRGGLELFSVAEITPPM